jgi:hypothetical protein
LSGDTDNLLRSLVFNLENMSLIRNTTALRGAVRAVRSHPTTSLAARSFSITARRRGGGHGDESPFEPPTGWLWGIKPGEKYEKEGWENTWFYLIVPSFIITGIVLAFKPDTS